MRTYTVPRASNSGALLVVSPKRAYPVGSPGGYASVSTMRPDSRPSRVRCTSRLPMRKRASARVSAGSDRRDRRGMREFYVSAAGWPWHTRAGSWGCSMRVVVSIGLALLFLLNAEAQTPPPAAATVMEWPEWLFPIHPPSLKKPPATPPKLDDTELLGIPDSAQKFT